MINIKNMPKIKLSFPGKVKYHIALLEKGSIRIMNL